ncbi:MAG: alpha/beta fold hydrolase, partial [Huintestinicola sp.]
MQLIVKKVNDQTPDGGINETTYVEINGTKQWINIYGEDKDAPVLLYLHGGPCSATSAVDRTCLRKLSKDYIVVNWDQRGCGHNYPDYKEASALTSDIMMKDGAEMTDYLRERFQKEKITLMGMSWGSLLGSNLVLEYPEKYDAMIAISLIVDIEESQ